MCAPTLKGTEREKKERKEKRERKEKEQRKKRKKKLILDCRTGKAEADYEDAKEQLEVESKLRDKLKRDASERW